MPSWKSDQNIAEYYTEPSSPARIFDGRINWSEKIKNMLTPSNKPNEQCIVELNSLKGECYPPQKTNEKCKVEKYPGLPQSKSQSRVLQHINSQLPKINSQYGKF